MKLARLLTVILVISIPLIAAAQFSTPADHPRYAEAVDFASAWVDLIDAGEEDESFILLSPIFQRNLTSRTWHEAVAGTNVQLGVRQGKALRRVVWYENPRSAPLPGLYAAVEFDSVFEHASKHFRYVMLHSQNGSPFRVMRNEATFALDKPLGRSE